MRFLKIIMCTAMLFFLCGCFDYNELNMQELVSGAAIDFKDGEMEVNVQCASTREEEEKTSYTSSGQSFFDAVRAIGDKADKKLYWGHARCLVIGEQAANMMDEILDTVLRAQDVYLDIAPVIAKGETAAAIFDSSPASGKNVADSISDMFANEANSRRFSALRVWEIFREREKNGVYILPTVSLNNGEPYMSGGAVVRESKIAGYLSGEQMLTLSLMTENGAGGYLPPLFLSQGRFVSFEILANHIERREGKGELYLEQECVLSPAEVRGDVSADEMKYVAEEYLKESFSGLLSFVKSENFGDILSTDGKELRITCKVRISNILGGK